MQIEQYLEIMLRRKWIILLVLLATVVGVAGLTYTMTPVYSATSTVRIARVEDSSGYYASLDYADRLISTYVELLQGPSYLKRVAADLNLNMSTDRLARAIHVESIPNTELLRITVESPEPTTAKNIANRLGSLLVEEGQAIYSGPGKSAREILQEQIEALEATLEENRYQLQTLLETNPDGDTQEIGDLRARIGTQEELYTLLLNEYDNARVREALLANSISLVEAAELPGSPSKPNVALNMALSVIVGLGGGIALAFLMENLNRAIRTSDGLATATRVPVLGTIPLSDVPRESRGQAFLLTDDEPLLDGDTQSAAGEAFRMLRSVLLSLSLGETRLRTILVTSASPGEGKSTITANLAKVIAQTGRRIIVVDSDLRRPCMHRLFGLTNDVGLSMAILGRRPTNTQVIKTTRLAGVQVVTSGPLPRYPAELLSSPSMQQLVDDLASRADMVLFDSPPLLVASDAIGLASLVDGVLLVAASDQVTDRQIQRVLDQLERIGARVVGTVLNRARLSGSPYRYYHDRRPARSRKAWFRG